MIGTAFATEYAAFEGWIWEGVARPKRWSVGVDELDTEKCLLFAKMALDASKLAILRNIALGMSEMIEERRCVVCSRVQDF